MFLMLAEALQFCGVAAAHPHSAFWAFLCHEQSHAPWTGCTLHDLIQPSFSFLVGAVLPFSLARRAAQGQSIRQMTRHAITRATVLVLLGIALRSINAGYLDFTFEDTLTQIGLGYVPLFFLALAPRRVQWSVFAALLLGYWLLFALYPLPAGLHAFSDHWHKNTHAAWRFDQWFLNLFPRPQPFRANEGGYSTLSFIPTLATMILGLRAGNILRDRHQPTAKIRRFILFGLGGLLLGLAAAQLGLCPIVKRIWTPSWVLYSGGCCFLYLPFFYLTTDLSARARWAFPLLVLGRNSLAAYCIANTADTFLGRLQLPTSDPGSGAFTTMAGGAIGLGLIWLVLYGLHRRKIFFRL
jgi:predicted acyltransferase